MSRARRIYYDWDKMVTSLDHKLPAAFDGTQPEVDAAPTAKRNSFSDDSPTIPNWVLVGLGTFAVVGLGGILVKRWWLSRKSTASTEVGVTLECCGLDILAE